MKAKNVRTRIFIGDQIDECKDLSSLYYLLPFQKVSQLTYCFWRPTTAFGIKKWDGNGLNELLHKQNVQFN